MELFRDIIIKDSILKYMVVLLKKKKSFRFNRFLKLFIIIEGKFLLLFFRFLII